MKLQSAKKYILNRYARELDKRMFYHDIKHSLDVYRIVTQIAENEKIAGEDLNLLQTASLYHDSGMLVTYSRHEEASVKVARSVLPDFGYDPGQIGIIEKLILSTKLPQRAGSELEKIICDADLDYLGREDYFIISQKLRLEWYLMNFRITSLREWYEIQIEFLGNHNYHTSWSLRSREKIKQLNLRLIKELFIVK